MSGAKECRGPGEDKRFEKGGTYVSVMKAKSQRYARGEKDSQGGSPLGLLIWKFLRKEVTAHRRPKLERKVGSRIRQIATSNINSNDAGDLC